MWGQRVFTLKYSHPVHGFHVFTLINIFLETAQSIVRGSPNVYFEIKQSSKFALYALYKTFPVEAIAR